MKVIFCLISITLLFCGASVAQQTKSPTQFELTGKVLDDQNLPLRSQVHALKLAVQDGHVSRFPSCDADTDNDGQFSCKGLEAGNYILQARPYPQATESKGTEHPNPVVVVYYPGVADLASAAAVKVGDTQQSWYDIHVPRLDTYRISGSLKGVPSHAYLRLEAQGQDIQLDTGIRVLRDTKSDTFYATNVSDGHYIVSAVWRDGKTPHRMAAEIAVQSSNVERIRLEEEPFVALHGSVTGDQADHLDALLLYREDNSVPKVIVPLKHGSFLIPSVSPGKYYFALPVHSTAFIAAVGQGDKVNDGSTITITPQSSFTNIRVVTGSPGAILSGVVSAVTTTSEPVRVIAEHEDDGHVSTVLPDAQGHFSISGLAAGEYDLFAWPVSEDPPYRSTQILKGLEKFSTTTNVDAGAQVQVGDLPLLHPTHL